MNQTGCDHDNTTINVDVDIIAVNIFSLLVVKVPGLQTKIKTGWNVSSMSSSAGKSLMEYDPVKTYSAH